MKVILNILTSLISELYFLGVDGRQWKEQAELVFFEMHAHAGFPQLTDSSILWSSISLDCIYLTLIFWMQIGISKRKSNFLNWIYQIIWLRIFFSWVFGRGSVLAVLVIYRLLCLVSGMNCETLILETFIFVYKRS